MVNNSMLVLSILSLLSSTYMAMPIMPRMLIISPTGKISYIGDKPTSKESSSLVLYPLYSNGTAIVNSTVAYSLPSNLSDNDILSIGNGTFFTNNTSNIFSNSSSTQMLSANSTVPNNSSPQTGTVPNNSSPQTNNFSSLSSTTTTTTTSTSTTENQISNSQTQSSSLQTNTKVKTMALLDNYGSIDSISKRCTSSSKKSSESSKGDGGKSISLGKRAVIPKMRCPNCSEGSPTSDSEEDNKTDKEDAIAMSNLSQKQFNSNRNTSSSSSSPHNSDDELHIYDPHLNNCSQQPSKEDQKEMVSMGIPKIRGCRDTSSQSTTSTSNNTDSWGGKAAVTGTKNRSSKKKGNNKKRKWWK